jgi:hypothetical protein
MGTTNYIPYNHNIESLVTQIGDAMSVYATDLQAYAATAAPLPYPMQSLRSNDGTYNVTMIAEMALIKMAWEASKVDVATMKRYAQFYLDNRSLAENAKSNARTSAHGGERNLYLSDEAIASANAVADALEQRGLKPYYIAKKDGKRGRVGDKSINIKMVVIIALCFARDVVAEKST